MASSDYDITNYLRELTLTGVTLLNKDLGRGAYGRVFTVSHQGITYAAKEIHSLLIDYANQEEKQTIKRNFLRECYYCSKLCHPNIVSFKGVYFPDKNSRETSFSLPVMVMELMDESLTNYVKKQAINMEKKLSILYDVSCGLDYLHGFKPHAIIHRDLSPNNILLVPNKVAKLSDLGVAKAIKADSRATRSALTKVPGTVDFMPPEAIEDDPQYSTSLDIFSYAGIVLYVSIQEWPTPSSQVKRDPQSGALTALSEVERRHKHLDKMKGLAEVLEPLVIACLNNNPIKRPAATIVVKILKYLMILIRSESSKATNFAQKIVSYSKRENESNFENHLMMDFKSKFEEVQEFLGMESHKSLNNTEVSVKSTGIGIPEDQFCLVNLSNTVSKKNEQLVCYLKTYTMIGRPDAVVQQDIQLKGLGIQPEHCVIEVVDQEVFVIPLSAARTLVNGKIITEKTKLCHGYRVLLGNNHFFRLSCPKKVVKAGKVEGHEYSTTSVLLSQENENDEITMNYNFAMKEVILNVLNSDPKSINKQMKQSMEQETKQLMEQQHFHENRNALEQQKVQYESQLSELQNRLHKIEAEELVNVSPPTRSTQSHSRPSFSPMLEAEWEVENSERVMDTFYRANALTREANMLSQALDKDTVFKVTMQIPPSLLSPVILGEGRYHQTGGNEIAVRVLQKARGTDSVWSMETFEEKIVAMRELFHMQEDEKYPTDNDITMDPFFDIEQHVLLGVANIFTQCLYHCVSHEYDCPVIGPTGKVCGNLKLSLQRVQVEDIGGKEDTDIGPTADWEVLRDPEGDLAIGSQIGVKIHVMEATGLPSDYCHFVFGQYKFWGQSDPTTIAPLQAFSPAFGKFDKLLEGELKFDHTQVFTVEVTEDFLDYLHYGTLSVEVYGHRRSGFTNEQRNVAVDEQHKSFPDRCCEVMKNLEMWVEILELNNQGSYVPVSIEERKDVKTGGVYVLRQGHSRRIQVKINPVAGSGGSPLLCSHITSIAIGTVCVRDYSEEPLDSYQDVDLDRLRDKWVDASMRRRDYLDKKVRKIMEKKGRTKVDTEKEQELIDQWTMLLLERSALLQPKPGSGVPGAPTRWEMSSGMEPRVITLYLDLNDDMLTPCDDEDPEAAISTAPLFGEKDDSMINLMLVKNHETMPEATASWDSSIHNAPGLNCATANNDRVYAILKVSIMLKHPPGIQLVLRKRICLHVIKKVGIGTTIMKFISSHPTHTQTGAMYEVVTGIPKLEGMFRPPKIPASHPSFVEVEEDENVIEKFKEGMMSVQNILALDQIKQEVCLKEKLAKSGQLLRPSHNTSTIYDKETAKNSNQSEDAVSTPPPQEEFSDMDCSVGSDHRVIQEFPGVEEWRRGTDEDRSNNALLDIPPTALLIHDAAGIVEQNKTTEDITLSDNDNDDELLLDGNTISLADVSRVNTEDQQHHSVKKQGSAHRSKSSCPESGSRQRTKSLDRPSSSDNSVTRRMPKSTSSARLSRKSIDHESRLVASSNSSLSSMPEEQFTAAVDQPPCTVGEKIMVDTPNGFKFGKVKFIGPTEFAAGEWIGIALERPTGKYDGTVKGVKYFKCKEKHGLFVRRDKIIRDPSKTGLPNQTAKSIIGSSYHQKFSSP